MHFRADPARFAPHKLALLAANSLTAAALYIRLWPVEQAGQAITQMHVLFHVGAWAAVVVTGMAMQRSGGGVGGGKKTAMD